MILEYLVEIVQVKTYLTLQKNAKCFALKAAPKIYF